MKNMLQPIITKLRYTYKKPESEVWVLNTDDIPIDATLINDQQIVHLAPGSVGGNHKHPRTEWFIGVGDLDFVWLDEQGISHLQHMHPNGQIILIEVPPFLPHAVRNNSQSTPGILFEFANDKMRDVEQITVA